METPACTGRAVRSLRTRRAVRSAGWLSVAAGLVAAAFALDDRLLAALSGPWRSGQANAAVFACRFFGEGVFVAVIAAAWWALAPRQRAAAATVAAAAFLAGGLATAAKPLTGRSRPEETLPRPAAESWRAAAAGGRNSSFPSGHTATAFALAGGLSQAFPPLRALALGAASGTAASRIREQRHYPSDCAVAAAGGWWLARAAWRLLRRAQAWRRAVRIRRGRPRLRLVA